MNNVPVVESEFELSSKSAITYLTLSSIMRIRHAYYRRHFELPLRLTRRPRMKLISRAINEHYLSGVAINNAVRNVDA